MTPGSSGSYPRARPSPPWWPPRRPGASSKRPMFPRRCWKTTWAAWASARAPLRAASRRAEFISIYCSGAAEPPMTTPDKNKQQWLNFAHTVEVLSASALAKSDMADAEARAKPWHGGLWTSRGRRVVGGLLAAACLLVIALPVSRLLDVPLPGVEQSAPRSREALPPGPDTI